MRILVLATDGFGGHGGIALYTRNVLAALCAHSSRPEVIAIPRVVPLEVEPLPAGLTWDVSGVGGEARYAWAVARNALQKCDLVVCTHLHLLPLAYAIRTLHRAPLILFVYGIDAWQPTAKPLSNRMVSKVDAIVSIRAETTRLLRTWTSISEIPEYVLENALHLEQYGCAPKNPALLAKYGLEGKTILMTMGRVEEQYKGFDEVLEALPRIAAQVPNIAYVVAGGGHDMARLQAKADALGVTERVVFTGFVAEAAKADHYRLADVYAMPGSAPDFDRYPFRFVFLEAMACGVPVVGCRPEDPEEARVDGSLLAELVDPTNPDDIVRGILAALRHRKHEIPTWLERFSFPQFQRRLHTIVDNVMSGRHAHDSSANMVPNVRR